QRAVMIGNPPRARIDVEPLVEGAGLRGAAELDETVAATQGPVAAAGAAVEFQDLHLVAGLAQFQRGRHAGEPGAQNQHRGAVRIAFQLDRTLVTGFGREPAPRHRVIHGRTACHRPDEREQIASPHAFHVFPHPRGFSAAQAAAERETGCRFRCQETAAPCASPTRVLDPPRGGSRDGGSETAAAMAAYGMRTERRKGLDFPLPTPQTVSLAKPAREGTRNSWLSRTSSASITRSSWCASSNRLRKTGGGSGSRSRPAGRTVRTWEPVMSP